MAGCDFLDFPPCAPLVPGLNAAPRCCGSSVVEHTLGKGEVTGSNPVKGFGSTVIVWSSIMAKKGNRTWIKLKSTESGHMYYTEKNRRNDQGRIELKKYDPLVRRHVIYREAK